MNYTDEQKEHIRHTFDYYCKKQYGIKRLVFIRKAANTQSAMFPLRTYRTTIFLSGHFKPHFWQLWYKYMSMLDFAVFNVRKHSVYAVCKSLK